MACTRGGKRLNSKTQDPSVAQDSTQYAKIVSPSKDKSKLPYVCSTCSKEYVVRDSFLAHAVTHTKEKLKNIKPKRQHQIKPPSASSPSSASISSPSSSNSSTSSSAVSEEVEDRSLTIPSTPEKVQGRKLAEYKNIEKTGMNPDVKIEQSSIKVRNDAGQAFKFVKNKVSSQKKSTKNNNLAIVSCTPSATSFKEYPALKDRPNLQRLLSRSEKICGLASSESIQRLGSSATGSQSNVNTTFTLGKQVKKYSGVDKEDLQAQDQVQKHLSSGIGMGEAFPSGRNVKEGISSRIGMGEELQPEWQSMAKRLPAGREIEKGLHTGREMMQGLPAGRGLIEGFAMSGMVDPSTRKRMVYPTKRKRLPAGCGLGVVDPGSAPHKRFMVAYRDGNQVPRKSRGLMPPPMNDMRLPRIRGGMRGLQPHLRGQADMGIANDKRRSDSNANRKMMSTVTDISSYGEGASSKIKSFKQKQEVVDFGDEDSLSDEKSHISPNSYSTPISQMSPDWGVPNHVLDKLTNRNVSVSRCDQLKLPLGVKLPPGITVLPVSESFSSDQRNMSTSESPMLAEKQVQSNHEDPNIKFEATEETAATKESHHPTKPFSSSNATLPQVSRQMEQENASVDVKLVVDGLFVGDASQYKVHFESNEHGEQCIRDVSVRGLNTRKRMRLSTEQKMKDCNVKIKKLDKEAINDWYEEQSAHEQVTDSDGTTGEKPFKCSQCVKTFNWSAHLKRHMKKHTGTDKKGFQCSVCPKRFYNLTCLTNHARIHTGEKPFQCSECFKTFNQPGNLKTHMIIHTGERPFQCSICTKKFRQRTGLTDHERSHNGDKPYQCQQCLKKFRTSSQCYRHKKYHCHQTD